MNLSERTPSEWTEQRLLSLISGKIEESLTLDYKAAGALTNTDVKKKEITKDVSAFANSAGGTIIYGITENGHLPGSLDPVDRRATSKEWLESVIQNIRPRIDGLEVVPAPSSQGPDFGFYVVIVPQSTTAHQAADHRYYKRFNFQSVPMEDHEVRDVMNRRKHPTFDLNVRIWIAQQGFDNVVFCSAKNTSAVFVEHALVTLRLPMMLSHRYARFENRSIRIGDDGYSAWLLARQIGPIFPEMEVNWEFQFEFRHVSSIHGPEPVSLPWVEYKIYAMDMPPIRGRFELKDICSERTPPAGTIVHKIKDSR